MVEYHSVVKLIRLYEWRVSNMISIVKRWPILRVRSMDMYHNGARLCRRRYLLL